MRTIYIDKEFKCHTLNDGSMASVETDFFDGMCERFVEGYRLIPEGDSWIREDGTVVTGLTIFPWKDYRILQAYQEAYDSMGALDPEVAGKAAAYDVLVEGVIG